MTAAEESALLGRIRPGQALAELQPAGLVIDAIVERLDIRQQLFAELESRYRVSPRLRRTVHSGIGRLL